VESSLGGSPLFRQFHLPRGPPTHISCLSLYIPVNHDLVPMKSFLKHALSCSTCPLLPGWSRHDLFFPNGVISKCSSMTLARLDFLSSYPPRLVIPSPANFLLKQRWCTLGAASAFLAEITSFPCSTRSLTEVRSSLRNTEPPCGQVDDLFCPQLDVYSFLV